MDISLLKQLMECSDDGGVCGDIQIMNCLKTGMRGHGGCGVLSHSRRLVASSRLQAKTERAPMRGPMQ